MPGSSLLDAFMKTLQVLDTSTSASTTMPLKLTLLHERTEYVTKSSGTALTWCLPIHAKVANILLQTFPYVANLARTHHPNHLCIYHLNAMNLLAASNLAANLPSHNLLANLAGTHHPNHVRVNHLNAMNLLAMSNLAANIPSNCCLLGASPNHLLAALIHLAASNHGWQQGILPTR
ncbi:hypothetical protein PCANC_19733 [Puccinia coronata f. sp. avenae]|uniref:Uncharacterized protein n=1 Tax=Puccinia coronata f. sp. avenae TaxID=200324 RepID=A0A2N5TRN8_9BASI|nr:hypothetical protein PCANC_19733 [Puccinia coronata f. sp. avenae]